jgi:hypothetical protein
MAVYGFKAEACEVIHSDGYKKNEDIFRDEHHVKITTGCQQQSPAVSVGKHEIQRCYNGKENKKVKGVK